MARHESGAARERRVYGIFVILLGAGLVLDHGSAWLGSMLLIAGGGLFCAGFVHDPAVVPDQSEPARSESIS